MRPALGQAKCRARRAQNDVGLAEAAPADPRAFHPVHIVERGGKRIDQDLKPGGRLPVAMDEKKIVGRVNAGQQVGHMGGGVMADDEIGEFLDHEFMMPCPSVWCHEDRRVFFSEEKKQKTFTSGARA